MFFRLFFSLLLLVTTVSAVSAQPGGTLYNRQRSRTVNVAVSPDGSLAAVARSSGGLSKRYGRVDLWDTQTGELQRTITGFDGPIWSLTFSKDGRTLITVNTEHRDSKIQSKIYSRAEKIFAELKWWNVETGEFIKKLPLAEEGVSSLEAAWSPDGNALALIERYVRFQMMMQVSTPSVFGQQSVMPSFEHVEEVDFKLLDSETAQRRVKLSDVERTFYGRVAWVFGRLADPVFAPDGKTVAAIFGEEVVVWNLTTGKKVRTVKKLHGWPSAIAFSPDSQLLAVASVKGRTPGESEISVWDLATGKSVNKLRGSNDEIACLQFVVRGQAILIGSLEYRPGLAMGTAKLWDLRDNRLKKVDIIEGKPVVAMTLINNQTELIVQSGNDVEVRDARTWRVLHTFESTEEDKSEDMRRSRFILTANHANAVSYSRDGTTVSAEIPGEGIRRWDARTGGVKAQIPRAKSGDDALLALSSDGNFVVETTAEGVRMRDLVNGTTKQIPLETDDPISALTLSQDNRTLITADESGMVHIWDAETGQSRKMIQVGQQITAVAIDASGQLLAAARADRSVVLWDLKTGAVRGEFKKHEQPINGLAFSPDGHTLASGGDERTVILWDIASGKAKRTLKGHDMTVTSLAFSPDGLTIASGSGNASVVLWNVTTGKLDRILR